MRNRASQNWEVNTSLRIIISWNVKRLGRLEKRALIKSFLLKYNPIMVVLQDTKLNYVDCWIVKSLWSARHIGWSTLNASGTSGDLNHVE